MCQATHLARVGGLRDVSRTSGAVAVVGRAGELGTLRGWVVHDDMCQTRSGAQRRSPP